MLDSQPCPSPWYPPKDSNPRPSRSKRAALSAELGRLVPDTGVEPVCLSARVSKTRVSAISPIGLALSTGVEPAASSLTGTHANRYTSKACLWFGSRRCRSSPFSLTTICTIAQRITLCQGADSRGQCISPSVLCRNPPVASRFPCVFLGLCVLVHACYLLGLAPRSLYPVSIIRYSSLLA